MDKNTVIGLLLIFALFVGYTIYLMPSEEQRVEQKRIADSIMVAQQTEHLADSIANATTKNIESTFDIEEINNDTDNYSKQKEIYGVFASAAQQKDTKNIIVKNDKYILNINPKGAQIESVVMKDIFTYDSLPVVLFEKGNNHNIFGFTFFSNYLALNTYDFYFSPININSEDTISVSGKDSVNLSFRIHPDLSDSEIDSTSYIEFIYTIRGDDYRTGFAINFVNTEKYISKTHSQIELLWEIQMKQQEQNRKSELTATNIYYSDIADVEHLKESPDKGDSTISTTSLKWISFKQLFFSAAIIANDKFSNASMVTEIPTKGNARILKNMRTHIGLELPENNEPISMDFYFGPNKYRVLKAYGIELENQIQLGGKLISWINKWIIIPIFNFLEGFKWNYGLIILVLTIIIKTVLFPVTYKNYISSAKMRVMKPEIEAINKRYPKQEDAMKKQQEIMGLYRQTGIKPMAGCLPMLLQMPILIAMFRFFPSAYELRQQSFLWAKDLSTYDAIVSWNTHIPIISSFYGNHISLFTLLMTIATLAYTVLNNKMMSPSGNDQQMKMMKWMMYLMPIMFLGIFNNYSSGLSYYYLLVNIITFIQMFFFRLFINEDKLRAKLLNSMQTKKVGLMERMIVNKTKKNKEAAKILLENNPNIAAMMKGPKNKRRKNTAFTEKRKKK